MFAAVLALGSLTAFANSAEEVQINSIEIVSQDFTEIGVADVPAAVTKAVAQNYPTATIAKAYVNEAKQYKLEVALEDGTAGVLYADEKGNWIDL